VCTMAVSTVLGRKPLPNGNAMAYTRVTPESPMNIFRKGTDTKQQKYFHDKVHLLVDLFDYKKLADLLRIVKHPAASWTETEWRQTALVTLQMAISAPGGDVMISGDVLGVRKERDRELTLLVVVGEHVSSTELVRDGHWNRTMQHKTIGMSIGELFQRLSPDDALRTIVANPEKVCALPRMPTEVEYAENAEYLVALGGMLASRFDYAAALRFRRAVASWRNTEPKPTAKRIMKFVGEVVEERSLQYSPSHCEFIGFHRVGDYLELRTNVLMESRLQLAVIFRDFVRRKGMPRQTIGQEVLRRLHHAKNADEYAFQLITNPTGTLGLTQHELVMKLKLG
jgi:hypothetical protein